MCWCTEQTHLSIVPSACLVPVQQPHQSCDGVAVSLAAGSSGFDVSSVIA
jgi:hypothetical protein